ncbi:MAG TPA: rod shape-determining protein MreD [Vicinamibacterales bacterium]|nr:rod shape-determining protein MreD [Vicinamibacterales bacterium]
MKTAGIILAIVLALALQTTIARFVVSGTVAVDLVLVVVVYVALSSGSVPGLLTGTVAGLIQDSLSTGVIGIGGLAKTIVGFITGIVGTQLNIAEPVARFVVFFVATVAHQAITIGLGSVLGLRPFGTPYAAIAGEALGNAVVGVAAFQVSEMLPGAVERRRMGRSRLRR